MDWKQEFVEEAKKEGLDLAEESLASIYKVTLRLGAKYCVASGKPVLVLIGGVLPMLEAPGLALIDKIDGKEG